MADEAKDLSPPPKEEDSSDAEEKMDTKADEKQEDKEVKQDEKESEKEEDEDDEESDEDEELQAGLLERPVVIEDGRKRERKKVERMTFQSPTNDEKKDYVEEGKGRKLGEIPYVDFMLNKTKTEDCKPLHRLLYRRAGQATTLKRMIRRFSGFPFSEKDSEYEKRMQILKANKFTIKMLKKICDILDVPRGGTKDEIIDRLMKFLLKPEDTCKKLPQKRKRGKGKAKGEKGKEKKKAAKKSKASKPKKSKATAEDDDDDDDEDDDDDKADSTKDESEDEDKVSEDEDSEAEDSEDEAPPKKKQKKAPTPKSTPKAKPKEKKPKEKPAPKPKKPTPKKKATPQKKSKEVSSDEVSDISSDSDDEPLVEKVKAKGPPTNVELKDVVKKMLEKANLEEVTMKTVLKDVYAKYPSHDLSDRKDFIKNTVKEIIS